MPASEMDRSLININSLAWRAAGDWISQIFSLGLATDHRTTAYPGGFRHHRNGGHFVSLSVGLGPAAREISWKSLRVEVRIGEARSGKIESKVEKLKLSICLIWSVHGW